MAGRGMNGLKGVIVCFDPNNQRYTLELEKGDMMSLKVRNVRKIAPEPSDDDGSNSPPHATSTSPDDGASDSSLPTFPSVAKEEFDGDGPRDDDNEPEEPRGMSGLAGVVSPVNAVLALLVAYFYSRGNKGNSARKTPSTRNYAYHDDYSYDHAVNHNHYDHGVSVPVMITFAVLSYLAWEWGTKPRACDDRGDFKLTNLYLRLSFCDPLEILGISALVMWSMEFHAYHIVSLGLLGFFVWKFGTRDGNRAFSWGNVKESASNLSIWEVLLVARLLQDGLSVLNSMAQPRRR